MFDILPETAVETISLIPNELTNICNNFRNELKKLPESPDRDGLLNAIGRVGKQNLKNKIKFRAKSLLDNIEDKLPEIELVIDEAVNCRNYYVHGTKHRSINYQEDDLIEFFTDTLEFVFATSDLMEAGWNIKKWISQGATLSHPFGGYVRSYKKRCQKLKAHLKNA